MFEKLKKKLREEYELRFHGSIAPQENMSDKNIA